MSLFVCDKCNCVDNTACGGNYWSRFSDPPIFLGTKVGEALCVECTPDTYSDGTSANTGRKKRGVWHNKFPKKEWDGKTEVDNR